MRSFPLSSNNQGHHRNQCLSLMHEPRADPFNCISDLHLLSLHRTLYSFDHFLVDTQAVFSYTYHIKREFLSNFPTTSLATIYKIVNLLKEIGEVVELDFSEGSNRYDGNKPYPYPHLICNQWKTIVDPDVATVSDLSKELVKKTGYEIVNNRLDFFVICSRY